MQSHGLLEFEKLKDEQISRIKFRDGLFYFTMLIIGGALPLALTDRDGRSADILLALPFAVFIAGVAHIACDRRIDDIGIYIRDILAPAVAEELKVEVGRVFTWEKSFHTAPLRHTRDGMRFVANVMLYVGSGFAALFYYGVLKERAVAYAKAAAVCKASCKDGDPVVLVTTNSWDVHTVWAGRYLMVLMLALIILFTLVKGKRAKITFKSTGIGVPLFRLSLSLIITLGVGLSVSVGWASLNAAALQPVSVLHWIQSMSWPTLVTSFECATAATATFIGMIAGITFYLVTRR